MLRNSITTERERDSSFFCFFERHAFLWSTEDGPAAFVLGWIDLQTGGGLDVATMGKEREIKEEWKIREGKGKGSVGWMVRVREVFQGLTFQSFICQFSGLTSYEYMKVTHSKSFESFDGVGYDAGADIPTYTF